MQLGKKCCLWKRRKLDQFLTDVAINNNRVLSMPRLSLLVLQYSKLNNLSCNSTRGRLFKHFYYMRHFSLMEKHSGPVQLRIQQKLGVEFCPTYLQVVNESYKHSVPPGSESHFKVWLLWTVCNGIIYNFALNENIGK